MTHSLSRHLTVQVRRYVAAVHIARITFGVNALTVATTNRSRLPGLEPVGVWLGAVALSWSLFWALAFFRKVGRADNYRPGFLWLDFGLLVGLMVLDKPWDSLTALPYGAVALLVPYARPRQILIGGAIAALLTYLPKVVALSLDWRYAALCAPVSLSDWMTDYVGPIFAATIGSVIALLLVRVRAATGRLDATQQSAAQAELDAAEASARRLLASRLHDTFSQAIRAIPLRLDGQGPDGLSPQATAIRKQVVATALAGRPAAQRLARELRGPA